MSSNLERIIADSADFSTGFFVGVTFEKVTPTPPSKLLMGKFIAPRACVAQTVPPVFHTNQKKYLPFGARLHLRSAYVASTGTIKRGVCMEAKPRANQNIPLPFGAHPRLFPINKSKTARRIFFGGGFHSRPQKYKNPIKSPPRSPAAVTLFSPSCRSRRSGTRRARSDGKRGRAPARMT